jgi:CheY-like chemotaxis protein
MLVSRIVTELSVRSPGLRFALGLRRLRLGVALRRYFGSVVFTDRLFASHRRRLPTALRWLCIQFGMLDAAAGCAMVDTDFVSFHASAFQLAFTIVSRGRPGRERQKTSTLVAVLSIHLDADHLFGHRHHGQFLISNAYLLGGRQLACLTCPRRLPGMDGYEVARIVRRTPGLETTVLTALTGWGQQEDRRRTAEAGFDHHLVKPPEAKAMESLLAALPKRL